MLIYIFALFLLAANAFPAPTFPNLTYSTFLRANFTPKAIATDSAGNVYLAGSAIVDATTSQRTMLVVKLNPQGTEYVYVRYIGGSVKDSANAIAVDAAGNAYIAGATESPDFPVTTGGNLGTAAAPTRPRSFLVKLDANGEIVFSDLLGGSASSSALAVAVNAAGRIFVTGAVADVAGPAFPSTAGAINIADTQNHPYLLALDPTGKQVVFSATGIGGSAIALDAAGNIFVAGSTSLLDYPTTAGSYQSTFPVFRVCATAPCSGGGFQGANQYVSKVDPAGATLLYSTAVSGMGDTLNGGLAIDAAGNAYLTGYAGATYPYTVTAPTIPIGPVNGVFFFHLPYVTKLDAAGKNVLFSVPYGGAGVQVSSGSLYVSGGSGGGLAGAFGVPNNLPALDRVPSKCLPDNAGIRTSAYVSQLDAATGGVMGTKFVGGSTLATSAVALAGSKVWVAGTSSLADFPMTAGAVTVPRASATALSGAFLAAIEFLGALPTEAVPQIFCIVDAADFVPVGAAAPNQLLSIFGTGLGPASGVSAPDNATTTLAGVRITADSVNAPLLYVSANQINFAVPLPNRADAFVPLVLSVNGTSAASRQLPLTFRNPSLFLSVPAAGGAAFGGVAIALNANGSANSPSNPAPLGSTLSLFVNGLAPDPRFTTLPPMILATNGWQVTNVTSANPFVMKVDARVPLTLQNNFACDPSNVCSANVTLYVVDFVSPGQPITGSEGFGGVVYVQR